MRTGDVPALRLVPSLEDQIRAMRRCQIGCPMVDTLDERVARQRRLVQALLEAHGLTVDELLATPPREMEHHDKTLQLWYHILRDCEYIDSLR